MWGNKLCMQYCGWKRNLMGRSSMSRPTDGKSVEMNLREIGCEGENWTGSG